MQDDFPVATITLYADRSATSTTSTTSLVRGLRVGQPQSLRGVIRVWLQDFPGNSCSEKKRVPLLMFYMNMDTYGGGRVEPLWSRRDPDPGHSSHLVRVCTPLIPLRGGREQRGGGRRWASGERSGLITW